MTTKRYKAYLMKFEPKWPPMTDALVDRAMREADFCMDAFRGLRVGQVVRTGPLLADGPNGRAPRAGALLKVVDVSHHGKLVTLEEVP